MSLQSEQTIVEEVFAARKKVLMDAKWAAIAAIKPSYGAQSGTHHDRIERYRDRLLAEENTRCALECNRINTMSYDALEESQDDRCDAIAAKHCPGLSIMEKEIAEMRKRFAAAERAVEVRNGPPNEEKDF